MRRPLTFLLISAGASLLVGCLNGPVKRQPPEYYAGYGLATCVNNVDDKCRRLSGYTIMDGNYRIHYFSPDGRTVMWTNNTTNLIEGRWSDGFPQTDSFELCVQYAGAWQRFCDYDFRPIPHDEPIPDEQMASISFVKGDVFSLLTRADAPFKIGLTRFRTLKQVMTKAGIN